LEERQHDRKWKVKDEAAELILTYQLDSIPWGSRILLLKMGSEGYVLTQSRTSEIGGKAGMFDVDGGRILRHAHLAINHHYRYRGHCMLVVKAPWLGVFT